MSNIEILEKLAVAFWGCFFGTALAVLLGSAVAYRRSLRRVALNAAVASLASAVFAVTFLGLLPTADAATTARLQGLVAAAVSVFLTYVLLMVLGVLRSASTRQHTIIGLSALLVVTVLVGSRLGPFQFLAFSAAMACFLGCTALVAALRNAIFGDRLAWVAAVAICFMLVALLGLVWRALQVGAAMPANQITAHAVDIASAAAATLYLALMACVSWARYAYLLELHKVMLLGPSYDPITRMRSHIETGQMVAEVFKNFRHAPQPLGIIVLNIANLATLEQLYGSPAANHALFVCATRLRRVLPAHAEVGRLGSDGFAVVLPHGAGSFRLGDLARTVQSALCKTVVLKTSREAARLETDTTAWMAEVGVGVLIVSNPEVRGADAVVQGRRLARVAISYASRIAWFDPSSGQAVEMPEPRLM